MFRKKTQKIAVLFATILTFSILTLALSTNFAINTDNFELRNDNDTLKISAIYMYIEIDALATTNTTSSGNWTWAKDSGYCT